MKTLTLRLRRRVRGEPYDELIDEFIEAAKRCAPPLCVRSLHVSKR